MSRDPNAPKAPKVAFLNKMIKRLDDAIDNGNELAIVGEDNKVLELLGEQLMVGWRDAFEWLSTMLENRTDYHKKRQIKQKTESRLLREALQRHGVDVAKIEREAEQAADDSLLDSEE